MNVNSDYNVLFVHFMLTLYKALAIIWAGLI